MSRHDRIRDELHSWLKSVGHNATKEQAVPEWDSPVDRAKLDVAYTDPDKGTCYLDVAVLSAVRHVGVGTSMRLERHERKKHTRYPGGNLIPFVLDVHGKWGREAAAWARLIVGRYPEEDRRDLLMRLRWRISRTLQLQVGEQCIRALKPSQRDPRNLSAATPAPGELGAAAGPGTPRS